MALSAVLETLDEVPEVLRAEYVEKDGKFYLDINGIDNHLSVIGLRNTMKNVKTEKAGLQAKIAEMSAKLAGLPDDFDPEKYSDIVAELDALKKDPERNKDAEASLQRAREQYEQRIANAERKRVEDLAAKDRDIAVRDAKLAAIIRDDGLTKALVAAGIDKGFLKAAAAMLKPTVKVGENDDGEPRAFVETDLGEQDVAEYVANWAKSDEGKIFVAPGHGGGAPGSKEKTTAKEPNPWASGTVNLTLQGQIVKQDRAKARRMMIAAGVSSDRVDSVLGAA